MLVFHALAAVLLAAVVSSMPLPIFTPAARTLLAHSPNAVRRDIHPIDSSASRPFNIDLVVDAHRASIVMADGSSVAFMTRAYNGDVPGPTVYAVPGDTFTITLRNTLGPGAANETNLHIHGLQVAEAMRPVGSMESAVLTYTIPMDHPSGTFWYHPHRHGLLNAQLSGLLAGAFVILDRPEDLPPSLHHIADHVVLVQGICTTDCSIVHDQLDRAIRGTSSFEPDVAGHVAGVTLVVNGASVPTLALDAKTWTRLRLVNAVANNVVELMFPAAACDVHLIARDGVMKMTWRRVELVVLPPGGRADVVIRCNVQDEDMYIVVERHAKRDAWLGSHHRAPSQRILRLTTSERTIDDTTTTKPLDAGPPHVTLPPTMQFMNESTTANMNNDNACTLVYEFTTDTDGRGDVVFGVNHVAMGDRHDDRANERTQLRRLTAQTWCVESQAAHSHPFHVHTTPFQIRETTTWGHTRPELYEVGEWRDTIPLFRDRVHLRFVPSVAGPLVSHCHIAWHADHGMGRIFDVVE
ncbi:Aste57867_10206 [Aphanomyces stellatus]|uniref:Aste57867_10206 protein n=1 Tax=Aphanomyces stellatus TaxID=120398 RepID=A0A485KPU7_9STRA|nr:hypothetical protein As57867_010167 [Aphanomyces stellatus]VFT87082.1 Aste57867_10206 [Aphanomyces stellatus]